jgi:hypothetical protein
MDLSIGSASAPTLFIELHKGGIKMDWLYIIFTACICFATVLKTLNEDSDSAIFLLLTIVLFLVGMGMFPQLFSSI